MSQPAKADAGADGRDGFTLIEALAALTIVTASLGALAGLTHQTARGVHFAERKIELTATARKALAALPPRDALADGVTQGELNGERWRMTVTRYPGGAGGWEPALVRLEVRDAANDRVEIDTVRLRRRGGS